MNASRLNDEVREEGLAGAGSRTKHELVDEKLELRARALVLARSMGRGVEVVVGVGNGPQVAGEARG